LKNLISELVVYQPKPPKQVKSTVLVKGPSGWAFGAMLEVLQGPMAGCRIGNKLSTLQGFLQVLKGLATKKQIIMVERSLNNTGGRITKKVFGKQMHKSMREQSSDFNNQRK